jgi:K+-sensing histidine kinase KdpD
MNLADNAAKYAQPSTPAVVELQVTCDERYCTICLRDHGPGVSASEKRKIFQPFHKSATAAAHSKPGVGLGLALSLRLAKEIHATLTCADAREGGAVFSLKIPF